MAQAPQVTGYEHEDAWDVNWLRVDDIHELHYQQFGKKDGKPVIFLHGGPGGNCSKLNTVFFNPSEYRVILLDQRGCGQSRPNANTTNNTTWHLVADIEALRKHLDISKWHTVFGGSWGSTLALAYAQTHPDSVGSLILRGIFAVRDIELRWTTHPGGVQFLFPDCWDDFINFLPEEERSDHIGNYHKRLMSLDPAISHPAATAWNRWELSISTLYPDPSAFKKLQDPAFLLAHARLEIHYFTNKAWLEDGQLLKKENVDRIRNIPTTMVQGRYDVVCPPITAWELHKEWPESKLHFVDDAGHSAMEPGTRKKLTEVCDEPLANLAWKAQKTAGSPRNRRKQHQQQSSIELPSALNVSDVIWTMTTTRLSNTTPPEVIDNHERVRAYEIAAYLSAASFPFHSPEGQPSDPVPSSDITLNALVQHGVHKMDCDRAFLSLIDNRNQFICAEMTRHQSLSSADPTDPLLLGTSRIALDWGVCPYTMSIFHGKPVAMPENPCIVADKSYFYIQDFRRIPAFAERPYVVGHPHMVSYLEIPLFAMSGHILGSYCVVDNKERDFLHPKLLDTMREVTSAISSYLDMRRVEACKSRAASMMQGLRRFVASDGRDARDVLPQTVASEHPKAHADPFDLDVFSATTHRETGSIPSGSAMTRLAGSDYTQSPAMHESAPVISSGQDADLKPDKPDLSAHVENLFVRAADNIGHAMDLDGLVFFDTVSTGKHRAGQSKDAVTDEISSLPNDSFATPLSCYHRDIAVSQQSSLKLSQSLIQRLTAGYPRGHVFAVDEHGVIQHGDEGEPDYNFDSVENNEWTDLFKSMPKTRYAIFLPMWHYQREACYATCLAWVTDTGKTLDTGDVNSLTAFGNSLMAEIFRLEASANTLSKSDFVSTMSHELRSPLHGILASIELIQENIQGSSLMPEIAMIESCASTLLDTFDHLLEYSKVNSRVGVGKNGEGHSVRSGTHVHNGAVAVDLARMVEDVIETVSVGHDHSSRLVSGLRKERQDTLTEPREMTLTEPVILTTHMDTDRDWTVAVEKGAWKRILLNVVSNALKYTRSGYIHVDLGFVEAADDVQAVDGQQAYISLSVTDTGVGMSEDFLKYHLFTPFTQENVLSPGTGLGLSLVKSIVESLQGKISVSSRLGEGTKITINIPTSQKTQKPNVPSTQESLLRGKTVGLLSLSSHEKSGNESAPCIVSPPGALERSIRNICEGRFGMNVINVSTSALPAMDIVLVDAHALNATHTYDLKTLLPMYAASICPVVVELGNTKAASYKVGTWRSMHTMLVTGKSLGSALISALEVANAHGTAAPLPPAEVERKPEIDPTEQIDQYKTTKKAGTHIENVALPHRSLPSQNTSSSDAATNAAPQSPAQPAALLKPISACRFRRLLLVDDNPINLKMLCAFAKRLNVPYSSATDGAEAVRLYQTAAKQEDCQMSYDCIFMDISMPVLDGFQAVSKIRKVEDELIEKTVQSQFDDASKNGLDGATEDNRYARAYIFALTGLGSEKARKQARSSGFDEFLLKPVRFKDVLPLLAPLPTP
ncbi:hypothetical protein G6011_02251 [Alternaria panax]|uniref:Prolyl aminopeptidase n=1 Tax=Alternaria panax TaxID=48097 RepID=A0AAD4FG75_9PLEO|nr:hypothetical protein G6011_02251 [Alternaria panax]